MLPAGPCRLCSECRGAAGASTPQHGWSFPQKGGIIHPGCRWCGAAWAVIAVDAFARTSSLPSGVQVAGVAQLCSCPPGAPAAFLIFGRSKEPFASLQRLCVAGSISLNRAGVSSECFQLVMMIKFPHIKSKVDFTFA